MVNKMELKNNWPKIKSKLKEKFPQLTESDLVLNEGKEEVLFAKIQEKTGKQRREIEQEIEGVLFTVSKR